MRRRLWIWLLACLLCLAGAWLFWPRPVNPRSNPSAPAAAAPPVRSAAAPTNNPSAVSTSSATAAKTNQFPWRLSNTSKTIEQLTGDRHAILLANAFIDTRVPLNFSIPAHLRPQGDPGAYIVQARGPIDAGFRAMLAVVDAQIISYIPNDAYLVRASAGVAGRLAANPLTQAVIPYEPYYKLQSSLLTPALAQMDVPDGATLTLGLFPGEAPATIAQIEKLGGKVVGQGSSPFGPVVQVKPPKNWTALATLSGVQIVEPVRQRKHANDLSRVTTGVAADTLVESNYMNLTGSNVVVEMNDSGVDASHPDLFPRVFGDSALSVVDTDGHGTHVAGIIAGNGFESTTVVDAQGSILTAPPGNNGTNGQFRGKAQLATLYSVALNNSFGFFNNSDQYLQEAPARTNALISNNSWNYGGDNIYDLAAASYDAAVRDALPEITGSQPVMFVFAAGNAGGGDDDGTGGNADTILSPATAKNVITVGALEQLRGITNLVTQANGSSNAVWQPETDSSDQVAWYSSRGNVGVGTEGGNGRFKPDVVAPGSFVLSTRSQQWDEKAYYNPTNYNVTVVADTVPAGGANFYSLLVPSNVVQVIIDLFPDITSATPFPTLPIWLWQGTDPRVNPPDLIGAGFVSVPPDSVLAPVGAGWTYAVSNNTSVDVTYDLLVAIVTTNANGNFFEVLSNLNDSIGPPDNWYRYESGTSMSAGDVSGVLALMQDYFTNTLRSTPSPALLKALLINGARPAGNYTYGLEQAFNFQGWGLISLQNSLPAGITNVNTTVGESMLFMDQSPTNGLATGDSHTYRVTIPPGSDGQFWPLQVTLAWTDPPGDPAAALKLVNSLELVVTNLDDPGNPLIYYGNDILSGNTFNLPWDTNTPANIDAINNVQNVFIGAMLGTTYTVTVIGRNVNVNAVTAQTNNAAGAYAPNVVQDYALVISIGEGEVTNAFTVTDEGVFSNPTASQQISYVIATNAPLLNQLVGASTPLLGTNQVSLGTSLRWGGTNGVVTLGMTNQWHFFVVTNTTGFTNAAFVTFIPDTLSIPRMGVFARSIDNATRPEADIDLYVTTDPALLNLDPVAISNCVHGAQVGASAGTKTLYGSSLSRGGTEFVVDTNSSSSIPGEVYYIGVYAEDQMASEFAFIPIFSQAPFSQMNPNGSQTVNGVPVPVTIPDGSPTHPGIGYIFGIALYPEETLQVVVTNRIGHQNFGDLIGTLKHGNGNGISQTVVLNNHDSLGNTFGAFPLIYDDSGFGNIVGSQASDGPGSLGRFVGGQGSGVWLLTEVDDSLTQTGNVARFDMLIEPHHDLSQGFTGTVAPLGWFYDFIDVPAGATSLTISATNTTLVGRGLLDLYVKLGAVPTLTDTNEFGPAGLTNGLPPGNSITINSPAPGRYWVGLYNHSVNAQSFYLIANLTVGTVPGESIYTAGGNVPLLDDAVTTDSIFVPATGTISSMEVGLRVDHPRVSDLVFHLISPLGTRVLLVENRGGNSTEGMGGTINVTNVVPVTSTGGAAQSDTIVNLAISTGTLSIFYNFYGVPDRMQVFDQSNNQLLDSGLISGSGVFNVGYTNSSFVTIRMNPGGNPNATTLWDYTVNALQSKQTYLVLTEDTNKTITPIKFAPPPFVPNIPLTTNPPAFHNSFEGAGNANYGTGSTFAGWHVDSGDIDALTPAAFNSDPDEGVNYIDLNGFGPGTISTNFATVSGKNYTLTFTYAQNADGPILGQPTASMQALQNGNPLLGLSVTQNNPWTSLGWSTTSVVFTATSNLTKLAFQSQSGSSYGVLLDCIDLTSSDLNDGFENTVATNYVRATSTAGVNPGFGGWAVITNQVTVISNSALAHTGTNLLALANGQIYRALPTTPGTTYTLSFAYRGPSAVALWRAETNTLDAIGLNDGAPQGGLSYANGEVGQAFNFINGSNAYVSVAASSSLDVGAETGLTIEGWINPDDVLSLHPLVEWNDGLPGAHFWISVPPPNGGGSGSLFANFPSAGFVNHVVSSSAGLVNTGTYQHVAVTYNKATGAAILYYNGVVVAQTNLGSFTPLTTGNVYLGYRTNGVTPALYGGLMDEMSIYNRDLSDSEINAIYQNGTAGKYNTNAPAGIAQGLAEAQMTLNGTNQPALFGDNTNWQTATYSFVATSTNTPLVMTGIEPGMLLDSFVMTTIPTNDYDLFYLPEQSLETVKGENAYGQWQLEVQDDRAGAPNAALVSWQLRFSFPFTPPTITTLTNTQVITNTVPQGSIAYYLVIVPTNADISTNILLNTTGPLNLIFDLANPPTGILPPDYLILSTPITVSNHAILTLTSFPTNFAQGGTYYLGVQNLNAGPVDYGIAVNFHLVPPPLSLPQLPELLATAGQLFAVTNPASGGTPPLTYTLTSSADGVLPPQTFPIIPDPTTNVITWTPFASQAPLVYTLTNIVTDSTLPVPQTATNIFHVLVLLTNAQPTFPGAEGAGGFAIGGRGGDVYHVVNVNDDGPGSLRFGIESTFGSRTIVFDVSGTINLQSALKIKNPYFTIAGQTAPGDGITIQGLTFSAESAQNAVESAHDEILRYLRCRPGDIYSPFFQGDSFNFNRVTNSIADHISASWSIDEVLSTTLSTNVTVQWSMIAEPLNHSAHTRDDGNTGFQAHGYGSLIRYGYGAVSYLHNLYADNYSRNPRVGDNIRLDFINNVVCNWGIFAGYNEDDTDPDLNPAGYVNFLNYRGNYFIAGSNTTANPNIAFQANVPDSAFTQIYQSTNLIDNNAFTNFLDGLATGFGMFSGTYTQLGSPTPMPGTGAVTNSPQLTYEQVLAFAGATVAGATAAGTPAAGTSLLRDPVDTNIVINVRNKSGQIIDFISPTNFPGGYFITNSGTTYSNYTDAGAYWVSQGLTNFVGVNPWPALGSAPQPLDSDGDGLPDYWEMTLQALGAPGMDAGTNNNNHSNPDGYTDLEQYLNWLGVPHALTVSNLPVAVDLYAIVGLTGNLSFGVTNGTNGTVTLGVDGHTATFMPTNDYFGFASFGFTVTNPATGNGGTNLDNGFAVTVSVMVSMTNIITSSLPITNAVPSTNTVPAGGIVYYLISVPVNAQLATNILSGATGPLNLLYSQVGFPTGTNTGDYTLMAGVANGISILSTNSVPTNIVPGGSYYLGVQNPNAFPVDFGLEVDFYPPPPVPPPPVPPVVISSIIATNIGGFDGYLLTWYAPTSELFQVQYAGNLLPPVNWLTFTNIVGYSTYLTPTNSQFTFFDDGSQTGGVLDPTRFYRLVLLGSGPGLTNGVPQTNTVSPGGTTFLLVSVPANAISVNNSLISATGPLNVFFNQTHPPTDNTSAGDFLELAAVTSGSFLLDGSSVPPLVPGANYYLGVQNPGTTNVTFDFQVTFGFPVPPSPVSGFGLSPTNGGYMLKWNGPTGYQYQVQWTTNLAPPVAWNTVSNIVLTSSTGIFTFYDDGTWTGGLGQMKYYRLIAYPFLTPIPQTLSISSVGLTNMTGTNNLMLKWSAPTNYHYGIQWTTNVALPFSNWSVIASPVLTQTNGVFTFIDNGQTGAAAGAKFFRLLEY